MTTDARPQYRRLCDYMLHQRKLAQDTISRHTALVADAAASTEDHAGHTTVDRVGNLEPLFEAAAWLAAADVVLRRRGATMAELRDFVDGHLQGASRSLVNSTSPTHNLVRIYQVMVLSNIIDHFNLEGWGVR